MIVWAICQIISVSDHGDQNRFPDPDLVMFVPEPHQSYDKIQHKEIYLYVLSSQKCSWLTFIRAAGSSFGNRVKTNVMKQHVIRSNSVTH